VGRLPLAPLCPYDLPMRIPLTLWRHVLREVGAYAGIGGIALGALLVLQNFLRQLEDLLALGVRAGDALTLLGAVALFLAGYALPIAFLFGVLVAIGQLSADSEVKAMRTLGVSLAQLSAPVFALAIAASAATSHLLSREEPAARRGLAELAVTIASRGGLIQPGRLSVLDRAGERLVLVDSRSEDGVLHGVFLADRTDPERPFVVAAREGEFALDAAAGAVHLRLRDGELHLESPGGGDERSQRIAFRGLDYAFDVRGVKLLSQRPRPREQSEAELRAALAHFDRTGEAPEGERATHRAEYEIQLQRRRALPLAPLLFAALGVPLALRRARSARSWGALVCVAVVFAYYVLLSAAEYLAKTEALPAGPALWLPNALFGALGGVLLWRARGAEA
jgi:lipopolysaccharide export system permease protein